MSMKVVWVPRSAWGSRASTESFIKARVSDPAYGKTEIHIHHSASIDDDDGTPNRWDYDEAVAYVKRLEWVRPDLGPLPYSECYAVSEDLGTVWVFEGRGWLKRGAHTGHHNVAGVGLVAFGNFNKADPFAASVILEAMETRVRNMLPMMPNLGSKKSPNGWNAWGHRDSKATSCPGSSLYPQIADFSLDYRNKQGENGMLPLTPTSAPEDIRSLQGRLNKAYGAGLKEDTNWGSRTAAAVRDNLLGFTGSDEAGDKPVLNGFKVNARMWNGLLRDLILKFAPRPHRSLVEVWKSFNRLQDQIDAIVVEPGTTDMIARRAADKALARLDKYNLHL